MSLLVPTRNEIRFASQVIENAVESDGTLIAKKFLEKNKWHVVAVESSNHLSIEERDRIIKSASTYEIDTMYLGLTETLKQVDRYKKFSPDIDGFSCLERDYSLFNIALFPNQLNYLFLLTKEDYYLLAGRRSTLEPLIDSSLEDAWDDFRVFAHDPSWDSESREFFDRLLYYYVREKSV